jgi:hypothetical protein
VMARRDCEFMPSWIPQIDRHYEGDDKFFKADSNYEAL